MFIGRELARLGSVLNSLNLWSTHQKHNRKNCPNKINQFNIVHCVEVRELQGGSQLKFNLSAHMNTTELLFLGGPSIFLHIFLGTLKVTFLYLEGGVLHSGDINPRLNRGPREGSHGVNKL